MAGKMVSRKVKTVVELGADQRIWTPAVIDVFLRTRRYDTRKINESNSARRKYQSRNCWNDGGNYFRVGENLRCRKIIGERYRLPIYPTPNQGTSIDSLKGDEEVSSDANRSFISTGNFNFPVSINSCIEGGLIVMKSITSSSRSTGGESRYSGMTQCSIIFVIKSENTIRRALGRACN